MEILDGRSEKPNRRINQGSRRIENIFFSFNKVNVTSLFNGDTSLHA